MSGPFVSVFGRVCRKVLGLLGLLGLHAAYICTYERVITASQSIRIIRERVVLLWDSKVTRMGVECLEVGFDCTRLLAAA